MCKFGQCVQELGQNCGLVELAKRLGTHLHRIGLRFANQQNSLRLRKQEQVSKMWCEFGKIRTSASLSNLILLASASARIVLAFRSPNAMVSIRKASDSAGSFTFANRSFSFLMISFSWISINFRRCTSSIVFCSFRIVCCNLVDCSSYASSVSAFCVFTCIPQNQ